MGAGTSSGSTTAVVTPEQTQQNQLTNQMLASYIPVLQNTLQSAQNTYNTVQPYVNNAALNTYNQAATSQGVNNAVTNAANNFANSQTAFSQNAEKSGNAMTQDAGNSLNVLGNIGSSTGLQGSGNLASMQSGAGANLLSSGAGGLGSVASQQAANGANLTNTGASALQTLFSPQYEQQQVQGALAPAQYAAQQANVGMNAGFAGAGQLGSSRNALANQQTQALNNQMLGSVAAQTEAGIQAQQANAANSLLNAGQTAYGQSQSGYGTLGNLGSTSLGQAGSLYSNLYNTSSGNLSSAGNLGLGTTNAGVNAGNTAVSAGGLGLQSNQNAVTNAAAQSSAAQSPLSAFNQFASTIFGVPSSTNTANFTNTQGTNTTGKGIGGQVKF